MIGNDVKIQNRIKLVFVKNKVGRPWGESELTLNFEKGLDRIREIIDFAINYNIIQKEGSRKYNYNDQQIAGSFKELYDNINKSIDLQKELKDKIYIIMKNQADKLAQIDSN